MVNNGHGTWNSQSECFISAKHSYATLKFIYDIFEMSTIQKPERRRPRRDAELRVRGQRIGRSPGSPLHGDVFVPVAIVVVVAAVLGIRSRRCCRCGRWDRGRYWRP